MTEIILSFVIVALLGLIAYMDRNNRKERKSLLNAILAKDHEELLNLEMVDKPEEPKEEQEDLASMDELTEDEFDEHILGKGQHG